jgi:hypothetical protein
MLVGHYPLSLFKGLTFKDAAKGFLAGIGRRLLGRVAVHCALDRNGIGVPINLPLIWIGRPIAVAHFDVKVGGVIGHDRNMRPNPNGRHPCLIQTDPLQALESHKPPGHDCCTIQNPPFRQPRFGGAFLSGPVLDYRVGSVLI